MVKVVPLIILLFAGAERKAYFSELDPRNPMISRTCVVLIWDTLFKRHTSVSLGCKKALLLHQTHGFYVKELFYGCGKPMGCLIQVI